MASKLYNLARVKTATVGTGPVVLGPAVSGFLTFALAGASDGDTIAYSIRDGASSEIGYGNYSASAQTLTRTVRKSTASNSPISLSGNAQVLITPSAEDIPTPYYPVINPSSGNIQGSGSPTKHQLVWTDANPLFWCDSMVMTSTDPSALNSITVTGTPATGTLTISFTFNSNTYNVPVSVTVGQTTTQVAAAIVTAIQANATLFTAAAGGNQAGGYGSGALIGYITNVANVVDYDYNGSISAQIQYTAGTTALTLTFAAGQSTVSTNYTLATALDNNPVLGFARLPGYAPPAGSVIFALYAVGPTSASPLVAAAQYGIIANSVVNSTTGSISGRWSITTPNTAGVINQGIYVGAGLYTVGETDQGNNTINGTSLWVNSKFKLWNNSNAFWIDTLSTNNPILLEAGTGGVGIAMSPTGRFDVNGYISSLGAGQPPTAGAGISLFGSATPGIEAINYATNAWLPVVFDALSVDFKPSNSTTSGFTISANVFQPDATNVSALGASGHYFSNAFIGTAVNLGITGTAAGTVVFANATSGTITVTPPTGALGTATLTLPDITDTLAGYSLANGGTNAILTASNGGIVWSNATQLQILSGTATANKVLLSGSTATPAWSTATFPADVSTTGQVLNSNAAHAWIATYNLTLGASGTLGSVSFGNATSGIITLQPIAGALGTVTLSMPATTDTLAVLGTAQTWTAVQTFTNSDIRLLGSSTGYTTFTSANSGASNFTLTFPAVTDTLAVLGTAQSFTAQETFNIARTIASGASAPIDDVKVQAATTTYSGNTHVTTAVGKVSLYQPTLSAASAMTVDNAATLYIDNAPTGAGAGPLTITNAWSILVNAGNVKFAGSANAVGTITSGTWNGTAVSPTYGGTGLSNPTAHAVLVGAGSSNITQIAVPASGTLFQGVASADPTWTATPTLGVQQTTQGQLVLANTAAGSFSTTVQSSNSASAAWTMTLPTTAGTNTYFLQTNGSGVTTWAAGAATFANPSASVGLSAVNGSAATAMRSDAAPALSQSIAPTWTGQHIWNIASTIASGATAAIDDLKVQAATTTYSGNTHVTTAVGKVSLYQPTLSAASALTVDNAATLYVDNAPTGGGAGPLTITNAWSILVNAGNVKFAGSANALGTVTSGTWNGSLITGQYGGTGVANTGFTFTLAGTSAIPILTNPSGAILQLGAADAASPVAQTIQVQNVVAGTSNTAGANFTINGSQGTGTGAGGSIVFQTAPAGTTGTSQNALKTAMTINSTGIINIGNGSFTSNLSYVVINNNASANAAFTPAGPLQLQMIGADSQPADVQLVSYTNTSTLQFFRGNGTGASVSGVLSGNSIGAFGWAGYTSAGAWTLNKARLVGIASEDWSGTNQGCYFTFETTATGGTSRTEKLRLNASGGLGIGTITDPGASNLILAGSIQVGSPTGGDKGAGTINVATNIYLNNTAYTSPDYVFEHAYCGRIIKYIENEGARDYAGLMPLKSLRDYTREHLRLPGITDKPAGIKERHDIALAKIEELTLYVLDLNERFDGLAA